jgi:hypothetical protein
MDIFRTVIPSVLMMLTPMLAAPVGAQADQMRVVQLKGKAVGETRPIPAVDASNTAEGNCFDVDMLDPETHKQLGAATRCFTDVTTVGEGLGLTETTFLRFPEGTIVGRNRVTIQPLIDRATEMTHLLGAVPAPFVTNLLADYSTEKFKAMQGRLRLGGVADLTNFREKNELTFDDLAVVAFTDMQEQVKQAQILLQEADLYDGAIDGLLGPQTRSAIRDYQTKHGLPTTGELDEATRKALGVQ